jgi:hypothetical protein
MNSIYCDALLDYPICFNHSLAIASLSSSFLALASSDRLHHSQLQKNLYCQPTRVSGRVGGRTGDDPP